MLVSHNCISLSLFIIIIVIIVVFVVAVVVVFLTSSSFTVTVSSWFLISSGLTSFSSISSFTCVE